MRIGLDELEALCRADQKKLRTRLALAVLLLAAVFFLFLCTRSTELGFLSPAQALSNLWTAAQLSLAKLLRQPLYDQRLSLIQAQPYYLETLTRFQGAVLAMVLGALLSVAGAVYQCALRNPIAVPSILGVSSGIRIANLALVIRYSVAAAAMTTARFTWGYLCGLGLLGLILLAGRLMGRRRASVADLLLVGSLVTRVTGNVVDTIQLYWIPETDYLALQQMSLYGTGIGDTRGAVFLVLALLAGLVPLALLRFSLNAASFPDGEARCLGVSGALLRVAALVCGTILVIAAQIHCGDVGMLALLVPHVCRALFGSNLKDLFFGCMVFGAVIMLLCKVVVAVFAFHPFLSVLSVGMLVNLVSAPLLIFVLLRHRRGWE